MRLMSFQGCGSTSGSELTHPVGSPAHITHRLHARKTEISIKLWYWVRSSPPVSSCFPRSGQVCVNWQNAVVGIRVHRSTCSWSTSASSVNREYNEVKPIGGTLTHSSMFENIWFLDLGLPPPPRSMDSSMLEDRGYTVFVSARYPAGRLRDEEHEPT